MIMLDSTASCKMTGTFWGSCTRTMDFICTLFSGLSLQFRDKPDSSDKFEIKMEIFCFRKWLLVESKFNETNQ